MNSRNLEEMVNLTGSRKDSFELMIQHLKSCQYPLIVETGVCSKNSTYELTGMSTFIWDAVSAHTSGTVQCVDADADNCRFSKQNTSDKTMVYCGDSVQFLDYKEREYDKLSRKIDLLYLDTYELDLENLHQMAQHHVYELMAIKSALRPGTLICIDNHVIENNNYVGPGVYVEEFMRHLNKPMRYKGTQWIWEW